jgi:hypothetical protein
MSETVSIVLVEGPSYDIEWFSYCYYLWKYSKRERVLSKSFRDEEKDGRGLKEKSHLRVGKWEKEVGNVVVTDWNEG